MTESPLLIYIHGFNSSPQSWKAQRLCQWLAQHGGADVEAPALSHWPAEAMAQLRSRVEAHPDRELTLIGSSLGGYYATWLCEHYPRLRAVLVNPAVYPYRLLAEWLGDNENIYTQERYCLTRTHLEQLQALDVDVLHDPSRYLLLVQTGDETLDYREAVEKFAAAPQFVQPGGSHGFEEFDTLIPAILAFARGQIQLPPVQPLPLVIPR